LHAEQAAQRGDQPEQLGADDVAFGEIDDPMGAGLAKADYGSAELGGGMKRGAPAGAWRGEVRRAHRLRLETLRPGGMDRALAHEGSQRRLIEMLELASTAATEMTARRRGMMRTRLHAAIRQ
jgi:hypothetical protein